MTAPHFIGDVRPIDPTVPHPDPMSEPAGQWEVWNGAAWRNLGDAMGEVLVIESEVFAGLSFPAVDPRILLA